MGQFISCCSDVTVRMTCKIKSEPRLYFLRLCDGFRGLDWHLCAAHELRVAGVREKIEPDFFTQGSTAVFKMTSTQAAAAVVFTYLE